MSLSRNHPHPDCGRHARKYTHRHRNVPHPIQTTSGTRQSAVTVTVVFLSRDRPYPDRQKYGRLRSCRYRRTTHSPTPRVVPGGYVCTRSFRQIHNLYPFTHVRFGVFPPTSSPSRTLPTACRCHRREDLETWSVLVRRSCPRYYDERVLRGVDP